MKKISLILIFCILTTVFLCACTGVPTTTASDNRTEGAVAPEVQGEGGIISGENDIIDEIAQNAGINLADLPFDLLGYIEYGYYPQSKASKEAIKNMSQTTDSTGYYVSEVDGVKEHYAKITVADVYAMYGEDGKNGYQFEDENAIIDRETYYFKVEPIKWRVFAQFDSTGGMKGLFLICDRILDNTAFLDKTKYAEEASSGDWFNIGLENVDVLPYANNYAYSDLRTWLNGTFYRTAIQKWENRTDSNVNSGKTIIEKDVRELVEGYKGDDVYDKVFALDYTQAKLLSLLGSDILTASVTDYARCRNTFMSVFPDYYGNGRWWLATTGNRSYQAAFVTDHVSAGDNGLEIVGESVGAAYMGVRPVIMLSVNKDFEILQEEEE